MATRYTVRADAVSWTSTDEGQIVILDLRDSRYLSLNPSAARLWQRLLDGAERSELVSALADAYGLPDAVAEKDVDGFLTDMAGRDLVSASENV